MIPQQLPPCADSQTVVPIRTTSQTPVDQILRILERRYEDVMNRQGASRPLRERRVTFPDDHQPAPSQASVKKEESKKGTKEQGSSLLPQIPGQHLHMLSTGEPPGTPIRAVHKIKHGAPCTFKGQLPKL